MDREMSEEDDLVTEREAAEIIGCAEITLRKWRSQKRMPIPWKRKSPFKNKPVLYSKSDVLKLKEQLEQKSSE